jgi:hypothetical protein
MTRTDWFLLPILAAILSGVVYAAFHWLGFFSLGLIGLLTGMVALQVELEGGRPADDIRNAALMRAALERRHPTDKAAWASAQMPIFIGKVVSAGLVVLGFGVFFLVKI